MSRSMQSLLELLDLEQLEVDLFRGRQPETSWQRVFGGQVAGQALVAAGRTVMPERHVHSLHGYFIRPGDPAIPIIYSVDRARDGRSFSTRRIVAMQHGKAIFTMSASFQLAEPGLEHQDPMPPAPEPESLPTAAERAKTDPDMPAWREEFAAIDLRQVTEGGPGRPGYQVWLRSVEPMPDSPLLHVCVLAYISDLTLLSAALVPHSHGRRPQVQMASLDHAMWFHRPFRADEWLLYDQSSPSASGARGFASGRIFTRQGSLVASVVQEGLIRPIRERPA